MRPGLDLPFSGYRRQASESNGIGDGTLLPPDVAFLTPHVDRVTLRHVVHRAKREGVSASRVLIAEDVISDTLYYRALADRLRRPFLDTGLRFAPGIDPFRLLRRGHGRRAAEDGGGWLMAPTDRAIETLLLAHDRYDLSALPIVITTPTCFSRTLRNVSRSAIASAAQNALPDRAPHLSARHAVDVATVLGLALASAVALWSLCAAPHIVASLVGVSFFAAMTFRLFSCVTALGQNRLEDRVLREDELPTYTVLVPLHREAEMASTLVSALCQIDYPRSKLEVFFLLEENDRNTERALQRAGLPPGFRVVVAPKGDIATKPRALNVGLMLAQGSLITVFDAEDQPESDQLRKAAARFASASPRVACLQARLAISNGDEGLLPRLFAIEYAVLFDLLNVGLATLHLPIPLGGTSNHFRTSVLRAAGGWDAWNVTEDADLGLRLAQFGFETQCLESTTREDAVRTLGAWMKQRRRWTKGWMQTALVLVRNRRAARLLGVRRALAVTLILVGLVVGPLLTPVALGSIVYAASHAFSVGWPTGFVAIAEAALAGSVVLLGAGSTLWSGYVAARARDIPARSLPLMLPYVLLVSAAAWLGLLDLIRRPYHWHKTEHGASARPARGMRRWPWREISAGAVPDLRLG